MSSTDLVPVEGRMVAEKAWQDKLIEVLDQNQLHQLDCYHPSALKNVLQGFKLYTPIQQLSKMITKNERDELIVDKKVKIVKLDHKNKICYNIGLHRLGGILSCCYWDRCKVKVCESKHGRFMVMTGEREPFMNDVVGELMGHFFHLTLRQASKEPIIFTGSNFTNVPPMDEVDRRKLFMQKFFVMSKDDNMENLASNQLNNKTVLTPMTDATFERIFALQKSRKSSEPVDFFVGILFRGVNELLNRSNLMSFTSDQPLSSESEFVLNLEPYIFIYCDV